MDQTTIEFQTQKYRIRVFCACLDVSDDTYCALKDFPEVSVDIRTYTYEKDAKNKYKKRKTVKLIPTRTAIDVEAIGV